MRDLFLDGMSRAACTVSVVTTDGPGGRAGVTVSAMSSLSADTPTPSLLVCINQQSVAGKTIVANGAFCVNVLRDDQITISDVFAGRQKTSSGDKFDAGVWRSSRSGTPVLSDALVAFDCQLKQYVPYGTHWILIGELTDIAINEPSSPLIYTNRAYGTSVPLLRSAAQIPTEDGERLRIGCLDIPGPFFMAQLVASFTSVWPHTRLDVVEADQDGLREAIRRSTVELAITYDLGIGRDMDITLLAELRPYVLLAAGHPLVQKAELKLDDLADEHMVLLDAAHVGAHQLGHFKAIGREPRIGFRTRSFEMLRSLVANGLGYAILLTKPAHNMSYDGKALAARFIADDLDPVRLVLVQQQSVSLSPAGQAFTKLCRSHFSGPRP